MNIRIKIKTLFIALSVALFVCPGVTADESEIKIVSPHQTENADFDHLFEAEILKECICVTFSVDGKEIIEFQNSADGKYSYSLAKEELYIGNHVFEVKAVFKDKTAETASQDFSNILITDTIYENSDFENYQGNSFVGGGFEYYPGNSGAQTFKADGFNSQTAFGLKFPPKASGVSDPYVQRIFSPSISGIFEMSFDIKMSQSDGASFYFEGKTDAGNWTSIGKGIFSKGIVYGDVPVEKNVWYNVKAVIDVENCSQKVYVNDTLCLENDRAFTKSSGADTIRFIRFAFSYTPSVETNDVEISFDNVKITDSVKQPIIAKAETDNETVKLCFNKKMNFKTSDNVSASLSSVFGINELSDICIDESENCITAKVLKPLHDDTFYTAAVSFPSENTDLEIPFGVGFKTESNDFSVSECTFFSKNINLISTRQIEDGDDVAAKLSFKNLTNEDKAAVIVLSIYDKNTLVSLLSKTVVIPRNTDNIELETPSVEYRSGCTPEISVIASWNQPVCITVPITLK